MMLYNDIIIMPQVRRYLERRQQLKNMNATGGLEDDQREVDERTRLLRADGKLRATLQENLSSGFQSRSDTNRAIQ